MKSSAFWNVTVRHYSLSGRTRIALERAGIRSIKRLRKFFDSNEILKVSGIGRVCYHDIKTFLGKIPNPDNHKVRELYEGEHKLRGKWNFITYEP